MPERELPLDAPVNAPLQALAVPAWREHGVSVSMLRLDAIDPLISGNKWFKLRYHLQAARAQGAASVLSFGGAYSNHLHALAAAAKACGLPSAALVRGERPLDPKALSPTLSDCEAMGMQLHFVSREEYRRRHDVAYQQQWLQRLPGAYLVPEGGGGEQGLRGASDIADCFGADAYDIVATACGTGTTLAGLVLALAAQPHLSVLGVSALKDKGSIAAAVTDMLGGRAAASWRIDERFHGGGFAKIDAGLVGFMQDFQANSGITLDPVYTAKLMLALDSMILNAEFAPGSRILAIHSGGLQGLRGMQQRLHKFGWQAQQRYQN